MHWTEEYFDSPHYMEEFANIYADEERTLKEVECIARELELTREDSVLDLACGIGRHTIGIAGRVGRIVGMDRGENLIEQARLNAADKGATGAEFIVRDIRQLDFREEFSAAYNYFTAWGYYDRDTNFDVLKRIRRSLKSGGRFLIEFIARDALMFRFIPRDHAQMTDGTLLTIDRRFDFNTGWMVSTHTYIHPDGSRRTIEIDHQLPSPDHLMDLVSFAGFNNCRLVAAPDGGKVQIDTHRIAVIGYAP